MGHEEIGGAVSKLALGGHTAGGFATEHFWIFGTETYHYPNELQAWLPENHGWKGNTMARAPPACLALTTTSVNLYEVLCQARCQLVFKG